MRGCAGISVNHHQVLFFLAAACIQLRLLANMLDGLIAVEGAIGSNGYSSASDWNRSSRLVLRESSACDGMLHRLPARRDAGAWFPTKQAVWLGPIEVVRALAIEVHRSRGVRVHGKVRSRSFGGELIDKI
jgi:hypothetical protein